MTMRSCITGAALAMCLFATPAAHAQTGALQGGVDLQLFSPVADGQGLMVSHQARVLPHLELGVTAFMGYSHRPLEVATEQGGQRIDGIIEGITSLYFAFGLGLFDWMDIALSFPVTLNQDRVGTLFSSNESAGGINDISLTGKVDLSRLILDDDPSERLLGFGLILDLALPSGDASEFLGSTGTNLDVIGVFDLHPLDDLTLVANAGIRFRTGGQARVGSIRVDNQIVYKFGAGYRLRQFYPLRRWELTAEIFGFALAKDPLSSRQENPAELLVGFRRHTLDEGAIFSLGVGRGLTAGVGSSDWRVLLGITFFPFKEDASQCPKCPVSVEPVCEYPGGEDVDGYRDEDGCFDPDNDDDGVIDEDDACPDRAEDYDGFDDKDGCPDLDNDKDGIPDPCDKCPDVPEDIDFIDDGDGCPEENEDRRVAISADRVVVLDKIYFKTNSDEIDLDRSAPVLASIAEVLILNPWIELAEIQGHTDNRGDAAYNLDLSQRRAKSVLDRLVLNGVAFERLVAKGYGETLPREPNTTSEGQASNRRVEFVIINAGLPGKALQGDSHQVLEDGAK